MRWLFGSILMLALLAAQPPAERRRGPREGVQGGPSLTIEEYEPKSTLVVPQHPVTRARYPFVDVHNHQNGAMAADKLVKARDGLNLQVMVNLSGGYGDKLAAAVKNMKAGTRIVSSSSPISTSRTSMTRGTAAAPPRSSSRTSRTARKA